ncbi:MAG: hypothetical protein LBB93_05285, partial [Elusimicrobiota bacterium]|nr:hypothetical protein [Elusimicrobiota bacterium]
MLSIFNFLSKHKKLYLGFLCFVFFCLVWSFAQIKYSSDVSQILPSVLDREMKLFQNSPLSNKLFVVVDAKSYQDAQIS